MNDTVKLSMDEYLKAAAPVVAQRQEQPTGKLSEVERTALQEASLAVVRQLRDGRTSQELQDELAAQGWKPEVAAGFIGLVSQLLAKMYLQRTWIFTGMSVFTCMIASMTVPQAAAGEFPWWGAVLSLGVAILSVLGALRNLQLYRQFRQPTK